MKTCNCGHTIGAQANVCPGCGNPTEYYRNNVKNFTIVALILAIVSWGIVALLVMG